MESHIPIKNLPTSYNKFYPYILFMCQYHQYTYKINTYIQRFIFFPKTYTHMYSLRSKIHTFIQNSYRQKKIYRDRTYKDTFGRQVSPSCFRKSTKKYMYKSVFRQVASTYIFHLSIFSCVHVLFFKFCSTFHISF